MMQNEKSQQSGFIVLLLVVILVVGAASYFGGVVRNLAWESQNSHLLNNLGDLNKIKRQLLLFTSNFPELYANKNVSPYNLQAEPMQASPGYLPCPFDRLAVPPAMANECSGYVVQPVAGTHEAHPGYVQGFLPPGISSRYFYFSGASYPEGRYLSPSRGNGHNYILLVDERFVYRNANFNSTGLVKTFRYAPLNNSLAVLPVLKLNDDGKDYVALLIDAGAAKKYPGQNQVSLRPTSGVAGASLNGYLDKRFNNENLTGAVNNNQDGDFKFYSASRQNYGVNDLVVGITYAEWMSAVKSRLCGQKLSLMASDPVANFWFNGFNVSGNPAGAGWRTVLAGGLCG